MSGANGDERGERDTGQDGIDGGIKPLAVSDPPRIGPYLLLGRLGAGGMGRVFLARTERGRTVAVKVVHEEHVSDPQFRARFRQEIEAAGRVGERYTAPVLDAGPDDEPPWVATGYVAGLSLEQVVRMHGPLPPSSVHTLADGLLNALADIHAAGLVHRDLKPSNVMLTVDGTKVIDFGIARALDASVSSLLTSTGMAVGSPGFMSPEQIQGGRAGAKSDVFTLGCVLTYAATGQLPFGQGASNQHAVMYQIVEGEPDLTGIEDAALRSLITRCLAKEAERRPGVDELLADTGRPRPTAARGTWLPAPVVAHLAQQSARLLDAEATPLREEPAAAGGAVDQATVGLRPRQPGASADTSTREERPRRRRTLLVLPVVAVLAVGGGTVALLQPFGDGGDETRTQPPGSSASATPGDSDSSRTPSSSPSGKQKEKGGGDGKDEDGAKDPKGSAQPDDQESDGSSQEPDSGGGAPTGDGSGGSADGGGASDGGASGGGSSEGSPPPALTAYKLEYVHGCVGSCDMPIKVSWSAIPRATRYDIHYTNTGSNFTEKNVDTTYSTGATSYTINGPFSGDEICVTVRAANAHGPSAWAEKWCDTVAY